MPKGIKKSIICETYVDGNLVTSEKQYRVVYSRKNGTEYVNFLNSTREIINDVYKINIKTLQANSVNDVLNSIKSTMLRKNNV